MTAVTRTRLHEGDPHYPRDEDPAASLFDPEDSIDDLQGLEEDDVDFEDEYPCTPEDVGLEYADEE